MCTVHIDLSLELLLRTVVGCGHDPHPEDGGLLAPDVHHAQGRPIRLPLSDQDDRRSLGQRHQV